MSTNPPVKRDRLNLGESLLTAQLLNSPNNIYCLVVQDDGNVGAYKKDTGCIWTSGTWASTSSGRVTRATLNNDGNFVMYTQAGIGKWSTNTGGKGVKSLIMQDDGNLVLSTGASFIWATNTGSKPATPATATPGVVNAAANPTLLSGQSLSRGEFLLSANKKFKLCVQKDGKWGLSSDSGTYWVVTTIYDTVFGGDKFSLQSDGNLCIFSSHGNQNIWSTKVRPPFGSPALTLRDTGDLVVTDAQGHVLWSNNDSLVSSADFWIKQVTHASPLVPGEYLVANQTLASPNGRFLFSFSPNGLLKLTDTSNMVLWTSNLSCPGASKLFLQFDGNLVLNTADGRTLWASNTGGSGESTRFVVNDDGNLGVSTYSFGMQWQSSTFFPVSASKVPIDRLRKGESLAVGQTLVSKNGNYKFQFQDNYNFTIRNAQNATTTYRIAAAAGMRGAQILTLNEDGLILIKDINNNVNWSSMLSTRGWINQDKNWCPIADRELLKTMEDQKNPFRNTSYVPEAEFRSAELVMQDDGTLAMLRNNTQFWNINTFPTGDLSGSQIKDTLQIGATLKVNESLTSYNGQYTLVVQPDNDICIYNKVFGQVWCSETWMYPSMADNVHQLVMQSDGNLVLYDYENTKAWATDTYVGSSSSANLKFVIQSDGNARVICGNNTLWETGTQGVRDIEAKFLSDVGLVRQYRSRGY